VKEVRAEDADRPKLPGSGITAFISPFNTLFQRTRELLSGDPKALNAIVTIEPVEKIEERIRASYHKQAKNKILAGTGLLLAALKPYAESAQQQSTPVTQNREFSFVKDAELRKLLERDYLEIQRAFTALCWKAVIILSGGAIEAILTDLLLQNESKAKAATKAPKKPDITQWDLADLINVCVELSIVSAGVDELSQSVREYRNLVHPENEIRNKLIFDAEEAKITLEVLHIIYRDLAK
jgi:hypothetical protein